MLYDFCILFFLFYIYSVVGRIVELLFCSLTAKKIVLNRGFLIGPYLPIYGTAAVIMTIGLKSYIDDPFIVFVMGAIISTIVEYMTSFIMEKLFKTRWWDYTNESFNINGRVCLKNSIFFGIGGLLIIYVFDGWVLKLINLFDKDVFVIVNIILFVLFIIDVLISNSIILKLRKNSELVRNDMTQEIREKVRYELSKNFILSRRLLESFPKTFDNIRATVKSIEKRRKIEKLNNKKRKEK